MQLKFLTLFHYIHKSLLAGVLSFLTVNSTFAQRDALTALQTSFQPYGNTYLQEKIYAHTDKNFYATGEIMWFKIYCVDGSTHIPLDVSKVAYAEVLDRTNKAAVQAKIELIKGEGKGSVYLPVTLASGKYRLRVYTAWMKNFGAETFFEKEITIVNPLKSTPSIPIAANPNYYINFFPEGGNLVNGLQSKLAFKATNEYGKGIDFNGIILNEANDTIAKIQPLKFGMGNFLFTPSSNHHYKAIITTGNKTLTKELPVAYARGYILKAASSGNQVKVTIQTNTADNEVYLIVHTNQQIKASEKITIRQGMANLSFNKDQLGEGIMQFTLFDNNRQPVCERLFFIRPASQLFIHAQSDAVQYASRKKINLSLTTTNKEGKPLPASLSMSVYRLDSLQQQDEKDIAPYLWLSSEIKGSIEAPGYYFESKEAAADEALDNLVLTQGWRRFRRKDATNEGTADMYPPEVHGPVITGKVIDPRTGKSLPNIQTFLSIPGITSKMYTYKSDDSGKVQYNVKDYYGPGEIVAQTNAGEDSAYRIEINSPFAEEYTATPLLPFILSKQQQQQLQEYSVNMQVQNVYSRDSLAQFLAPAIDTLPFYGLTPYTYLLDDYTRFTTVEEILREYVREINVRKKEGKLQIAIINEPQREFFESNYLILIDGVPVFDQAKLFSYDPLKIRKLEVVPKRYFSGYLAFNGIASFSTYKGEMEGLPLEPKAIIADYEGLQLQREFYSPVYETEKQVTSRLPDFRNLLYWSPEIITTGEGKKEISFYTSDQKGKYLVVVQGITKDGKAAGTSFSFEVNR